MGGMMEGPSLLLGPMLTVMVGFFFYLHARTERNEVMEKAEAAAVEKKEGKTLEEIGFDLEKAKVTLQKTSKRVLISLVVMSIGSIWVLGTVAYWVFSD